MGREEWRLLMAHRRALRSVFLHVGETRKANRVVLARRDAVVGKMLAMSVFDGARALLC